MSVKGGVVEEETLKLPQGAFYDFSPFLSGLFSFLEQYSSDMQPLRGGQTLQSCMWVCVNKAACKFISERMCTCYLQQLKGSEQFPSCAVPSVNLVVLQLWWEPRGAVVLVAHLDDGLRKRPTYELCLTLSTAL